MGRFDLSPPLRPEKGVGGTRALAHLFPIAASFVMAYAMSWLSQDFSTCHEVGDKCKLMRPKAPRVRDKCGRQGGDNCKIMRPKAPRMGDKGETSVNSCSPKNPEWETRGRQV